VRVGGRPRRPARLPDTGRSLVGAPRDGGVAPSDWASTQGLLQRVHQRAGWLAGAHPLSEPWRAGLVAGDRAIHDSVRSSSRTTTQSTRVRRPAVSAHRRRPRAGGAGVRPSACTPQTQPGADVASLPCPLVSAQRYEHLGLSCRRPQRDDCQPAGVVLEERKRRPIVVGARELFAEPREPRTDTA